MQTNLKEATFIQIENLVRGLVNKKTMRSIKKELAIITNQVGVLAEKCIFNCLFSELELKDNEAAYSPKDKIKIQYLKQFILSLNTQSRFGSLFYQVAETSWNDNEVTEKVKLLISSLELPLPTKLAIYISLTNSNNQKIMKQGINLLKEGLIEYYKTGKQIELPQYFLADLLTLYGSVTDLEVLKNFIFEFQDKKKEIDFVLKQNYEFLPDHLRSILNYLGLEPKQDDTLGALFKAPINKDRPSSIAEMFREMGPHATHSLQTIDNVFAEFSQPSEEVMLDILLMFANNTEKDKTQNSCISIFNSFKKVKEVSQKIDENKSWDMDNFFEYVKKHMPNLSWVKVIKKLDRPNLEFKTPNSLLFLFDSFKKIKSPNFNFPTFLIFKRWKNTRSQAKFLINAFRAGSPETLFLGELPKKDVKLSFDIKPNLDPSLKLFAYTEIVEILLELSESDLHNEIRDIFELSIPLAPELFFNILLQVKAKADVSLVNSLFIELTLKILNDFENYINILTEGWKKHQSQIFQVISGIYRWSITPILHQKLMAFVQSLPEISTYTLKTDCELSHTLALVSTKDKTFDIKKWTIDKIKESGNLFLKKFLNNLDIYIKNHKADELLHDQGKKNGIQSTPIKSETLNMIFQGIKESNPQFLISSSNQEIINRLNINVQDNTNHHSINLSESSESFIGIDKTFHDIFTGQKPLTELIEKVTSLKNSNANSDRKLYIDYLITILDESRFFPTYKLQYLNTMADLYAGILNSDILDGKLLEIMYNILISALEHPSYKMTCFGLRMISLVKDKLILFPELIYRISCIKKLWVENEQILEDFSQKLKNKDKSLYFCPEYIEYTLERQKPPEIILIDGSKTIGFDNTSNKIQIQEVFNKFLESFEKEATKVTESMREQIAQELSQINQHSSNVKKGVMAIKKHLTSNEILQWISRYLLCKKIPREPNSHKSLLSLISSLEKHDIYKYMVADTYILVYKLLEIGLLPEADLDPTEKETLINYLKAIGSWLGNITLGRNKPILMKDLDLKSLIIESFDRNNLDVVLPMVSKILAAGANHGTVFKANNAWVKAILSVLIELNELNDTKMALKCEIDVILQEFSLNKNEILSSKILQKRIYERKNLESSNGRYHEEFFDKAYKTANKELSALISHEPINKIDIKSLIIQSCEKSLRKILVEICFKITSSTLITTKILILKDFAMEPDERKWRSAAKSLSANTACNLAFVIARDPLKNCIQLFLTESLNEYKFDDTIKLKIIKYSLSHPYNTTLDLLIKIAGEKVSSDVLNDIEILDAMEKRRAARESGGSFKDHEMIMINQNLPEKLRSTINGLTPDQLKIYDDFDKIEKPKI